MNGISNEDMDVTIEICGSAGDGSIASGQILNLAITEIGYHVMNFDSYPAEIRGFGKSVAHSRLSNYPIHTTGQLVDCLIALDDPHSTTSLATLKENSVIIYDSKPMDYHEENQAIAGYIEPGMIGYGIPLRELSVQAVGSGKSRNIVSLGAIAAIFRIPPKAFHSAVKKRFGGKKQQIIDSNIMAFDLGYGYAAKLEKADAIDFGNKMFPVREGIKIISGNEAVVEGCLDAGIKLYAGYPITPATKILELLAKKLPKRGGVVAQTEDEISAIGHAIGGGFAGRRCATATSGPGLCLMVEMLNLAVMAEVPVVVIDSQRGGPSTGLPTKTEQADLNLAVLGASGDSPRPVVAPANVEECYHLIIKAFEIAEAFQTPVVFLLDFFLSNRMEDVLFGEVDQAAFGCYEEVLAEEGESGYERFALRGDGISPRAYPGMKGLQHTITGLEHTEKGLPNYNAENHRLMGAKRYNKMRKLAGQWPEPKPFGMEGELEVGIIAWGSTIGSAMEAVENLNKRGVKAGGYFPRLMWPLHEEALRLFASRCRKLLVVEMNTTGQYANFVDQTIGTRTVRAARVYAGPYPVDDILAAVDGL